MKTPMSQVPFSRAKPIDLIRCLKTFKHQCDGDNIPEGVAVRIAPEFLHDSAYNMYVNAHVDSGGGASTGGFTTWPGAVNHLIAAHLTDDVLDDAVAKLRAVVQQETEPVKEYHKRVGESARRIPGIFSPEEIISIFISGLRPELKADAKQLRPNYRGENALHQLAQMLVRKEEQTLAVIARTLGRQPEMASRSRRDKAALSTGPRPKADAALVVEPGRRTREWTPGVLEPETSLSTSGDEYFTPAYASSHDYAATAEAQPPEGLYDDIAVVEGHPTRFDKKIQGAAATQRPPSSARESNRTRRSDLVTVPRSQAIPNICFTCYTIGHIAPRCPHQNRAQEPRVQQMFLDNFARLDEVMQAWLKQQGRLPNQPRERQALLSQLPQNQPTSSQRIQPRPTASSPPPSKQETVATERQTQAAVRFEDKAADSDAQPRAGN